MESKFLADGRKVAIVGQLNQQEWIVQEVFVTESGDEIPAGERFTTKSLLDEPAKTYKQKELEKLEAAIAKRNQELSRYSKEIADLKCEVQAEKEIQKCIRNATAGAIAEDDLGMLVDFLTGNINWIVERGYGHSDPIPFREAITGKESQWREHARFDSLKLISLYGGSEGDLTYRLSRYSDGSGSGNEIFAFRTFKEAVRKSIDLTMRHLEGERPTASLAIDLLKSKSAPFLTERELGIAKALVEKQLNSTNETFDNRAADVEKKRVEEIKKLTELLNA